MNNIHAEVDEILRTGNKKAIVALFLSMQGNYIRATEAEAKLAKAEAEIERLREKIKGCSMAAAPMMLEALEMADELIDQLIIDNTDNYAEERATIRAAIAAAKGKYERI